jgi:hypothetical protein
MSGTNFKSERKIDKMSIGQKMEIEASDFGFGADLALGVKILEILYYQTRLKMERFLRQL